MLIEASGNMSWFLEEAVWQATGQTFQTYAARPRKQRDPGPRRILADFLIGAHALEGGYSPFLGAMRGPQQTDIIRIRERRHCLDMRTNSFQI
jgi:hypothetical protein